MKTINTKSVILGIAVFAFAHVGALAAENKPAGDRPDRPEKPNQSASRPSLTGGVKDAVKSFQEQKKTLMKEQVETVKGTATDARNDARGAGKELGKEARQEAKDSLQAAKRQATEQARKLAEEAAAAAKENRPRGKD